MNWEPPGAVNQPEKDDRLRQESSVLWSLPVSEHAQAAPRQSSAANPRQPELRVGRAVTLSVPGGASANLEVFTLSLGNETIELLPFKNWTQLDHYKWLARGKLPGEPAGLEITLEHLKVAGETVALKDPEGAAKVERLFNDWLFFEKETLALARSKAQRQSATASASKFESRAMRFQVELDKRGQVHIHCVQGRETLATVGLTAAGLNSLVHQGLMRKPQALNTGALHDWVELDGELCSFEKGRNDAARLETLLNERYLPATEVRPGKAVLVSVNAASPTGFDIQFPVMIGGELDNHRHHLNEQSLELLQDPDHCGLLQKGMIVKLIAPNLVFKQKTPDGGEDYLPRAAENTVTVTDEDGHEKTLLLNQPLNLLRSTAADLTAVFNHPAINRYAKARPAGGSEAAAKETAGPAAAAPQEPPAPPIQETLPAAAMEPQHLETPRSLEPEPVTAQASVATEVAERVLQADPLPNIWLRDLLARPPLQHDWFARLTYSKMAEWFGRSEEGKFGPFDCWYISLGEVESMEDPEFKGVFLTERGGLGFLSGEHLARFYNGVAFLGTKESVLEGIHVQLLALGYSEHQELVFVVSDDYRKQFGVAETELAGVLENLRAAGGSVLGVTEALASRTAIEVVWTAPVEQMNPEEPEAVETTRLAA